MKILAHRGYWNNQIKKNSLEAIKRALENGYGFESDVRDFMGRIVISHNIADASSQPVEEVFQWLHEYEDQYCFAINIKADGMKDILKIYIDKYNITNYFLFDMSVPQMIEFREAGLRYFTRQSEVEPEPCMYEDASGIWIDGFWSVDWITEDMLREHISARKEICLVSPELHGKSYIEFWEKLKLWDLKDAPILLCTDYPDKAKEFFYE